MSQKRLQVLLEPGEYKSFREMARMAGLSLGEWVRRALRRSAASVSKKSAEEKLQEIRRLARLSGPTGEIGEILDEIEQGRFK